MRIGRLITYGLVALGVLLLVRTHNKHKAICMHALNLKKGMSIEQIEQVISHQPSNTVDRADGTSYLRYELSLIPFSPYLLIELDRKGLLDTFRIAD